MTGTTDTGTSGTDERVRLTYTFNPTSGTREHMGIYLVQAVSQSGGANGITRGLYIQPTLTSAANYRAIETTSGSILFQNGSVTSTSGFTGSLQGTASWATSALTASRVQTVRTSAAATHYLTFVDSSNGAIADEAIYTTNAVTINPSLSSISATSFTGSLQGSSSYALTASYALNGGGGSAFPYVGNAVITGSLIVSGTYGGINTFTNKPNLFDINGITRVNWTNGVLNSSVGDTTVDWELKQLNDAATTGVLDWENKILYDSAGASSMDWTNRTLSETTNTWVALEYSDDTYLSSQLYYRNIVPAQVQRSIADTPASKYGGQVIQATVDGAVTDFQLVYLDTDGIWYALKNLTIVSTKMVGICVDAAGGYVLVEGDIGVSDDSSQGAVVTGADHGLPVYISSTTGEMTTTTPASGVIRILGHIYYQSTTDANWWTMKFRPSNDWYEI